MVRMNEQGPMYVPINAYGVIGDCRTVVLVAPDGAIDWGCFPDFDSPAIFCRLLDAQRGGYFQIAPTDTSITGSQHYLHDSNILRTTFSGDTGQAVLTDFMPVETLNAWSFRDLNNNTWQHEDGSCHCLVRKVECLEGELALTLRLKVTPHYATVPSEITLTPDNKGAILCGGDQYVGLSIVGAPSTTSFALFTDTQESDQHPTLTAHITLQEGERIVFVLGVGRNFSAARRLVEVELVQRNFESELAQTLACWRDWVASCNYRGFYSEWVRRSALTLKMLTYAPTGAIVAAATTSLPEDDGGTRNWDYRFTWLRDASFTLHALITLGFTEETRSFTRWLLRLSYTNGEDLQIMYGIRGEKELPEQILTHLSGYRNSAPVRIGNEAAEQRQMDVFGEVIDCVCMYWERGYFERYSETPDKPLWNVVRLLVEYVCDHWCDTDSGIWEVRHQQRHFVYSKLMCWVALDRGIRAAQLFHLEADLTKWLAIREQIREDILSRGYNVSLQSFTQSYDDPSLDASNLVMPLVGFIEPSDEAMHSTVERTMEQLTDTQGFVYRYRSDDGVAGDEGTFIICTFWLIENLALQGRLTKARELFERVLKCAGPLGLFSEETQPGSNMALGNYPQAFTHIALINCAVTLQKAEKLNARSVQTCA